MADLEKIADSLSELTIMEAADLVKMLEEKWGVEAAKGGGMMMAMPAGGGAEAAEEQTEFDVHLTGIGDKKIQVIKVVREITGLGLKEAKDLVEAYPKAIKEGIPKEDAEKIKEKIEAQGGAAEIK